MKKTYLRTVLAACVILAKPMWSQNVKLAKIALGMDAAELKAALASESPIYSEQASDFTDLRYLIAQAETEAFAFTLIDGKLAAFSVTHRLSPGQQPFLPAGQQPTVSILRDLITKQTWTPAKISKGDTFWFSGAAGAPLSNVSQCAPQSGQAWLPFGHLPNTFPDQPAAQSTSGLMKPAMLAYAPTCGASIHLNESPSETEDSVVAVVQYQVLDIKVLNAFQHKHPQR